MYKVTRIYLGNVGHDLAWYEGVDIPFTDAQTGDPTHTIFNLMNQGGKSTFLSMFFTLFDSSKDRFLQHLRNNAQRFEQYFDADGLPGLIAVEWQLPDDLVSARRLVTGLIVIMKKSGELFEPERHFFVFESNATLSYDSLPAAGIEITEFGTGWAKPANAANGNNRGLRNRDDAWRWLQEMESAHPGNFQRFNNQNEWKACLESRGVDVEMLRRQVEFNRMEGGMGESFLDFKSEREFIRKWMMLTLNPETAEQTHETVSTLCTRMKGRARLIEAQQQLDRFSQLFDPFAGAARDFHSARKSRTSLESALADVYATLEHHMQQHRLAAESARTRGVVSEAQAREAAELHVENAGIAESYQDLLKLRQKTRAEANEERARQCVTSLEQEEAHLLAGQLLTRIHETVDAVAELERLIDEASNSEIAPLRARASHLAALVAHFLRGDIEIFSARLSTLAQSVLTLEDARRSAKAEERRLGDFIADQKAEGKRLEAFLEQAEKMFAQLIRSKAAKDLETAEEARSRLAGESEEEQAVLDALQGQVTEAHRVMQVLSERRESTVTAINDNRQNIKVWQERIASGDREREELAHSLILCQAAQAEIVDVDSEILPARLREFMRGALDELASAQLKLARLQDDHQSILDTGLAGRDPDVLAVMKALSDRGVRGVRSFAQYLAEVLPDQAQAREVVTSDPARFLGVTVPEDALPRAREILADFPLQLIRPVVVSEYSITASQVHSNAFTVPAGDDSAYSKQAAAARANTLSDAIEAASGHVSDARKTYDHAVAVQEKLRAYSVTFGAGRLDALKTRQAHLQEQTEGLLADAKSAERQLETLKTQQTELASQIRTSDGRCRTLSEHLASVVSYLEEYGSSIGDWRQRLEASGLALADLMAKRELAEAKNDEFEQRRQAYWTEEQELKQKIEMQETLINSLVAVDPDVDARAELEARPRAFATLEAEYVDALTAVQSAELQTTAPLKMQRDMRAGEVERFRREYNTKFPESRCASAAVQALLGTDIEERLGLIPDELVRAKGAERAAVDNAARERSEYIAFRKDRRYPAVAANEEAELLEDSELGSRFLTHRRTALDQQEQAQASTALANAAREEADRSSRHELDFHHQLELLESQDLSFTQGVVKPGELSDIKQARSKVRMLVAEFRSARATESASHDQCARLHDRIAKLAQEEAFARVDVEMAAILRDNTVDASIEDFERLEKAAENRRDTVEHELNSMKGDLDRGTNALVSLATDGLSTLKRAYEDLTLPASLAVFGGKPVIKLSGSVFRLTADQRREHLAMYMSELSEDGNIPESGAALTAECIQRLAPGRRLDLKVLKLVTIESQQYVPVDGLSNSGAEKISMAMFLYFVIAKLRYEQRADSKHSEGGVLVLDNPFSTATSRRIWESILALADAMKIQLIMVTGIKEYDTLSVFKRFVKANKVRQNLTKQRDVVGIVDYQFKAPTSFILERTVA